MIIDNSRLKNKEVIKFFIDFDIGSNHNRSLRIIENKLYSYELVIAARDKNGFKVLNPELSPSQTTKKHINLLLREIGEENIILASNI